MHTSNSSSKTQRRLTNSSSNSSQPLMICRHRGYCFSFVPAPGPTTPSAICRRHSRTTSRSTTTSPPQQLWQNSRNPAPLPAAALARAHLPLADGGLGLLSATCLAPAAYWASWAVTLPILHTQAPHFIAALQPHFQESTQGPHQFQATQAAAEHLTQGWLGTSALRATSTWSRAPAPAKHRRPRSAHIPQRLAATRCGSTTQSHERQAAQHAGPRQPSHARIPIRALCQQSLHHHSLLRRPVISVPLVSNLTPQAPPPPASPH